MSRLRRPSPALVVACLALAVALGGTGYAAVKLPANSVGTKQLKAGAVVGAKVKPHSLLAESFKNGQLPGRAPRARSVSPGPRAPEPRSSSPPCSRRRTGPPRSARRAGSPRTASRCRPTGAFQLAFAQDVSNCAVIAAPGGKPSADTTLPTGGEVSAQATGGGAVSVQTYDLTGTQTALGSFTVAVFC